LDIGLAQLTNLILVAPSQKNRKNCMKELMARVNGNQDVDGHKRRTSTFFISISDRINFMINNG
jgi:hypothetical protein